MFSYAIASVFDRDAEWTANELLGVMHECLEGSGRDGPPYQLLEDVTDLPGGDPDRDLAIHPSRDSWCLVEGPRQFHLHMAPIARRVSSNMSTRVVVATALDLGDLATPASWTGAVYDDGRLSRRDRCRTGEPATNFARVWDSMRLPSLALEARPDRVIRFDTPGPWIFLPDVHCPGEL